MAGTHVFYNGVLMRDCETKLFDQESVLDDSRNLLTTKFNISVESTVFGFFNGAASEPGTEEDLLSHPSTVITDSDGNTATDRMHFIQNRLNQPRKDFYYATHGGKREDIDESVTQIMLAATGSDIGDEVTPQYFQDVLGNDLVLSYKTGYNSNEGDANDGKIPRHNVVDTNNGPLPKNVRITQLFGGRAFRVSFEIEVHRHLCLEQEPTTIKPDGIGENDDPEANEFVISNTWSSSETCDEAFRRSRVVEGTLRVRDQRYWAHGFRSLCLPGLMPGYRRVSQHFVSDPTNLVLKYRVEDRQAEAAPPWPAIDWVMVHTDSAKNEYGMVERQLSLKLIGQPHASKSLLVGIALNILDSRFRGAAAPMNDPDKLLQLRPVPFTREGLIITQPSDKPEVELVCNIRLHVAGIGGFEGAISSSGMQLGIAGYNPDNWPAPRPYDANTPAGIFACYLQSPCNQWHGMPEWQTLNLDATGTNNYAPVSPTNAGNYWEETDYQEYQSAIPLTGGKTADVNRTEHINMPYTHYEVDNRYTRDVGKMILPYSTSRDVAEEGADPDIRTAAVIPIHAGLQKRVITVVATRHGRPPEIPEPADELIDPNGITEHLIDSAEMVIDGPRASSDQSHRVFTIQAKFVYGLVRTIANTEVFRSANNPSLISVPGNNWLPGFSFFSRGRVEYHNDPDYGILNAAPYRDPGDTYDANTGGPAEA